MAPNNLVLWTGPVQASNLDNLAWTTPTTVATVNKGVCGVPDDPSCHKSAAFASLAKTLNAQGAYPTKIDDLLARVKLEGDHKRTVLSGFSAGYALVEGLLTDKPTADKVDVVMGLDCYYFQHAAPGFLAFAQEAAQGRKLMIMTTSGSADAGFLTPSEGIKALLAKFDTAKLTQEQIDEIWPEQLQRPVSVEKAGNLFHVAYGTSLYHGAHATKVGPALLQAWVSPYLAGLDRDTPPEPGDQQEPVQATRGASMVGNVAAAAVAAAAVWMLAKYLRTRSEAFR